MTMKDDYINFLLENNLLIERLKNESTLTYDLLEPIIEVMNFISDHDFEIDGESKNDCEDIFQIGFQFLYQEIENVKRILEENFEDEIDDLIEFDQNLYLYIKLDDIDSLLNESNEVISNLLETIQQTFEYRKIIDDNASNMIEEEIEKAQASLDEPMTSDMFMDFADTLGIELI